jgi:hypothetical protein
MFNKSLRRQKIFKKQKFEYIERETLNPKIRNKDMEKKLQNFEIIQKAG